MELFAPALIGGAIIGIAASLLLWLDGRIAGVSGIAFGLWPSGQREPWRVAFLLGLPLGALLVQWLSPITLLSEFQTASPLPMIIAGLLVGAGTRMGGGCTSGHGVCGLARFSARSMVATLTFLVSGIATVYVLRHLVGVVV